MESNRDFERQVIDRLARMEQKVDGLYHEQDKKNKVVFDLLNEKIIPSVPVIADIKERFNGHNENTDVHVNLDLKKKLNDHIEGHTKWLITTCSVVGVFLAVAGFLIEHFK